MRHMYRAFPILALAALALTACGGNDGTDDPCEGIVCSAPDDTCDGDVAVSYTGAGVCLDGDCDYAAVETRTDCAASGEVCSAGACVAAAECTADADCAAVPAGTCDGQVPMIYGDTGTCTEAGACEYTATAGTACGEGEVCSAGACEPAPECDVDADCDLPQADYCDGETPMLYGETGTCEAGSCVYTAVAGELCGEGTSCLDGTCTRDQSCTSDATCTGAISCSEDRAWASIYEDAGVCDLVENVCQYETRTYLAHCEPQGQVCVSEQGCVDCETAADCATEPFAVCDGLDVVTYSGAATCAADFTCAYETEARETCAEACHAGSCETGTSAQIAAVRQHPRGGSITDLRVEGATVTYLLPGEGFYVQAEQDGPAVFVNTENQTVPTLNVGDTVSFDVNAVDNFTGFTIVTGLTMTGADVTAGDGDVSDLVQDISAVTRLGEQVEAYESELVSFDAQIQTSVSTGRFRDAGPGYTQVPIVTEGMVNPPEHFLMRMPNWVRATTGLGTGCSFSAHGVPVYRFVDPSGDYMQPSAYRASDLTVTSCPTFQVESVTGLDDGRVRVRFTLPVDSGSVSAADFTLDGGITVTGAAVDPTTPEYVLLTVDPALAEGVVYQVTVAADAVNAAWDGTAAAGNLSWQFTAPVVTPTL